jgi:hypothetical protein
MAASLGAISIRFHAELPQPLGESIGALAFDPGVRAPAPER